MPAQNFKKQKTRFFVLAFAMSFFVLAMMGLIVVFVFNPVEEEKPSSQISADSFYLPREEDNLTILLTGRAPQEKDALFFALVRLDMLGGRIPVILFPPQCPIRRNRKWVRTHKQMHCWATGWPVPPQRR